MTQIDILMATYNGEAYIDAQIDSIVNQSYRDWRLLIRDDGSTDRTRTRLANYAERDSRIQIVRDDKGNLGVSGNFGLLLALSEAPYVMFADQDDIWEPEKIATALTAMQENERETPHTPLLVFTNSMITNSDLSIHYGPLYPDKLKCTLRDFLFSNAGYQGAAMLFNDALRQLVLPLPSDLRVHDYYISLVAHLQGKIQYLPRILSLYRRHTGAINPNNTRLTNRIRSFLAGNATLYYPDMKLCLEQYMATHTIKPANRKILDTYLSIIDPKTPVLKRIRQAIRYRFTLRNSIAYLILKLLIISPARSK